MKKFLLSIVLLTTAGAAMAQTGTVTGVIKNQEGDLLHFAYVQNDQHKGAYTDSLGNFSITAAPNSTLHINCAGYKDTSVIAKDNLQVVLRMNAVEIIGKRTTTTADDANRETVKASMGDAMTLRTGNLAVASQFDAARGATLPSFNPKEETQGSRYLVKGWAHGTVINSKGETIQNPNFLFAYDKMGGGLLLTKDKLSAIEIDRDLVKSFTIYDNVNNAYTFENVPQIDQNHYVELISTGNKYKIYKAVKTTFVKSNYTTDGVMSQGNNYDEYVDEYTYYVYNVQNNALQKITLKKKAIKETFAADGDKVTKFISDHSSETIDDTYLASLGDYMNE